MAPACFMDKFNYSVFNLQRCTLQLCILWFECKMVIMTNVYCSLVHGRAFDYATDSKVLMNYAI